MYPCQVFTSPTSLSLERNHLPVFDAFFPHKCIASLGVWGHLKSMQTHNTLKVLSESLQLSTKGKHKSIIPIYAQVYHQRDVTSAQMLLHQSKSEPIERHDILANDGIANCLLHLYVELGDQLI